MPVIILVTTSLGLCVTEGQLNRAEKLILGPVWPTNPIRGLILTIFLLWFNQDLTIL